MLNWIILVVMISGLALKLRFMVRTTQRNRREWLCQKKG